ncbi:MAG: hypothetical protein JF565_02380 [Propionibacteriales bacterium]|jgi:hypothetical protein|nr:hypothetical protein [Propionibacteriales bacterium]
MSSTVVASANILYKLRPHDAYATLTQVLAHEPDLVGLQEWYVSRLRLLRQFGDVRVVPSLGTGLLGRPRDPAYHWVSAVAGGNVVGARAERFEVVSSRVAFVSGFGRSDRPDRTLGIEPPRVVTIGVFRDRQMDRTVAMMSYHLTPGVEVDTAYHPERPRLEARHRSDVQRLEALVAEHQQAGHVVYAVGDSNFDSLRLAGLTSAWEGREHRPGTIGSGTRKLDDVQGPGRASRVTLLTTPSDHKAVVAVRPD